MLPCNLSVAEYCALNPDSRAQCCAICHWFLSGKGLRFEEKEESPRLVRIPDLPQRHERTEPSVHVHHTYLSDSGQRPNAYQSTVNGQEPPPTLPDISTVPSPVQLAFSRRSWHSYIVFLAAAEADDAAVRQLSQSPSTSSSSSPQQAFSQVTSYPTLPVTVSPNQPAPQGSWHRGNMLSLPRFC